MVIAWRQFNSILSDFRQAGWGYTTDAACTGRFLGFYKTIPSAATL
jgi:hypothetical protein